MFLIAELGSMHKGIAPLAYEMVRRAKLAGADAVKFQFGWPKSAGPMRCWATENAGTLREWCTHFGIRLGASVFSWAGLAAAETCGVDFLKMAHRKTFLQNAPATEDYDKLLRLCLEWKKPVFVSGLAVGTIPLYCVPRYPVYQHELKLPDKFNVYRGYSSHTHGIEDALLAIARGARVVEKHVTLDKTEATVKDNHFAISFDELEELSHIGRRLEKLA
jgi:sialic acid synthase SpsE